MKITFPPRNYYKIVNYTHIYKQDNSFLQKKILTIDVKLKYINNFLKE